MEKYVRSINAPRARVKGGLQPGLAEINTKFDEILKKKHEVPLPIFNDFLEITP